MRWSPSVNARNSLVPMVRFACLLCMCLVISAALSGCRKEEEPSTGTDPNSNTGSSDHSVTLHTKHTWGADDFSTNTEYPWGNGNVRFQEIRYYLSDFVFMGDTETADFTNTAILVDASSNTDLSIGPVD